MTDEIVVRGRRPPSYPYLFPLVQPGGAGGPGPFAREPREVPYLGFLSPGIPQVIDEIIVTAPKPGPTAPGWTLRAAGALRLLGWLGIAGFSVAELERRRIQQQREEDRIAKEEAEARRKWRLAQEEMREVQLAPLPPELEPTVNPLPQVAPMPVLPDPDADPAFTPTIEPFVMPQPLPAVRPLIEVQPVEIPQIRPAPLPSPLPFAPPAFPLPFPQPMPRVSPKPKTSPKPETRPGTRPGVSPQVRPLPFAQPFPQPTPTPIGLTGVGPSPLPFPMPLPMPQPQPQPQQDPRCKPCPKKKKRKEKRKKCWKKMVIEAENPDADRSYNWVRVDCKTGRETRRR